MTSWLKQLSLPQAILVALLTIHTVWIGVHLVLVSQDRINPWKLGGYGMYTRPQAVPFYEIEVLANPGDDEGEWVDEFDDWGFYDHMKRTTFHCEAFNPQAMIQLFEDNEWLIGSDLKIAAGTTEFLRDPIRLEPVYVGEARVIWQDETRFEVSGAFCEKDFGFEASL